MSETFAIGIGGAAGQGVATPGDIFAMIFSRRGLHLNAYNAYQSIIRGGHTFLTIRTGVEQVECMGDGIDLLIPLNQDTMDRHLRLLTAGGACIYNEDTIKPGAVADGVQLCPLPVSKMADITRNKVAQNTLALGAALSMMGVGFQSLESVIAGQFGRKGEAVVKENVDLARTGYEYATANFKPFARPLPMTEKRYAVLSGNTAMAMGGAAAGVKFYCAYPMSPSTGVLHWMAGHGRKAGIMVRQMEDEIGVINMAIGAAHAGVRSMCATSGGGFALMTEGLGLSAMAEIPVVAINCQRARPIHRSAHQDRAGRPMAGARRGVRRFPAGDCRAAQHRRLLHADGRDFQRHGPLPVSGYRTLRSFALRGAAERRSKGAELQACDRSRRADHDNGDLNHEEYLRYKFTESGVSPRAIPGLPGYTHTVASDEHEENGVLISDEYTNAGKRRAMMDKRMRKVAGIEAMVPPPALEGPTGRGGDADRMGIDRRDHSRGARAAGRARNYGKPVADSLAGAAARRRDPEDSARREAHHHCGEQLQWAIRTLSAQRNQLRGQRAHPQVRRRALHAAPHCRGSASAACRFNHSFRSNPRSDGLRR